MARDGFDTIAGCRIKVMRAGVGAPLVFLHGAGGVSGWTPFMERLSESFDLIVPQHPGFGDSDSPDWLDNIGDLAFFYLDLVRHLGLSGLHLVGTSIGGWIASELAIRDCSALASLTLVAPAGLRLPGVPKADIFMLPPDDYARRLFYDARLADAAIAHQPSEAERDAQLKNRLTTAKLAWAPRLYSPDLHKWLHRISAPTLIAWGEDDQIIPRAYGPAFNALIPNSRVETIARCGHLPHVEKAEELAALITAFCREARP
ncbi:MAG TPA: alpha/beta fold hydrolase [Beijerinckiaceae bacterium]|nr:alpha/beta fold hydrolase [Beijerinckiaceae bacterium]